MTKITHEFTGEVLADGRQRVTVLSLDWPRNQFNPGTYTTVSNIDGSNRLMSDGVGWNFLPNEFRDAAGAALAKARGEEYRFPHMVPAWAQIN